MGQILVYSVRRKMEISCLEYNTFNKYIYNHIPLNKKILDVGCATGLLGQKILCNNLPKYLGGIEINSQSAREAKRYYDKIVIGDIEDLAYLPFENNFFDIIICSDILEHLRDPLTVLKKLASYLKVGGFFLISVPNVAFILIRKSLLFGNFNYTNSGILDKNHLRFFTVKSLLGLLSKTDLRIIFIRGYSLVRLRYSFLKVLGYFLPSIFSLQLLVKLEKGHERKI